MSASSLVAAGFGGYQGWGDAEADADFRATGGSGKETNRGGGGGGGSSGGFQPLKAPDLAALEQKIFEAIKPYYIELVKQADGDLNRAKQQLIEDYKIGVRVTKEDFDRALGRTNIDYGRTTGQANEDFDRLSGYAKEDLTAALDQLGITFPQEIEARIDDLNRRGMAVMESAPGAAPEVLTGGRGAVEMERLRESQRLRKEAVDRTANRALADLGITKERITNPNATDPTKLGSAEIDRNRTTEDLQTNLSRFTNPAGTDGSLGSLSGLTDRSGLGSAELELLRGTDTASRNRQLTGQNLRNQLESSVLSKGSQLASQGIKANEAQLGNYYTQSSLTDFLEKGL